MTSFLQIGPSKTIFKGIYTNADLKIFLYVQIHIKVSFLNLRIIELFTHKRCIFLKN